MATCTLVLLSVVLALSSSLPLSMDTNDSNVCFVSRSEWGAHEPVAETKKLESPVPYVVIHHTYRPEVCKSLDSCKLAMRSMQEYHQVDNGWADIVGGEGRVYEGRGWNVVGAHAVGYNSNGIGIALIGDWVSEAPSQKQLNAAKRLIEIGVRLGRIAPDYKLIGHRQASATECPGEALFEEISTWKNFAKM
ncbi:hypothetical protein ACJJTC_005998 [Scirpophaga incertulas]